MSFGCLSKNPKICDEAFKKKEANFWASIREKKTQNLALEMAITMLFIHVIGFFRLKWGAVVPIYERHVTSCQLDPGVKTPRLLFIESGMWRHTFQI